VLSVTTVTIQSIYAAISAYLIIGVAVYNAFTSLTKMRKTAYLILLEAQRGRIMDEQDKTIEFVADVLGAAAGAAAGAIMSPILTPVGGAAYGAAVGAGVRNVIKDDEIRAAASRAACGTGYFVARVADAVSSAGSAEDSRDRRALMKALRADPELAQRIREVVIE